MKKEPIETRELEPYIDALNGRDGVVSEYDGKPCRIKSIRLTEGLKMAATVETRINIETEDGVDVGDLTPDDVRLYRREFEDGDYVRQADGSIVICAGLENGKYLFHAALDEFGDVDLPGEFYTYGSVMPADRLCTEQEMMKLNGAMMKQGKIFDIVQKKVVDSVFKQNPELWEQFLRKYEEYRRDEHEDKNENQVADTDVSRGGKQTTIEKFGAMAILPYPLSCHRGVLHTLGDVREALAAYEDRIQELTDMCDEVYAKLKDAEAQPITTNP